MLAWSFYCVQWRFYDENANIDEKGMQILNMIKANKTLVYKWDAHIRISFTMSIEQRTGLLLVYMQAQQIQITADAAKTQMKEGAKT